MDHDSINNNTKIENNNKSRNQSNTSINHSPHSNSTSYYASMDECLNLQENSKIRFDKKVKRFYHQLDIGCMNEECEHKLCKVAHSNNKLTSDACLVMSFQLASKPGKFQFCDKISVEPIFPLESSTTTTSTTLLNEQTSSTPSQPPSPCSNRLNLSQNTPTAFSSLLLNALSNKNRVKEDSINNSIGSCQKGLNTKSITLGESFTNLMKSVSFSNLFASMNIVDVKSNSQLTLDLHTLNSFPSQKANDEETNTTLTFQNVQEMITSKDSQLSFIIERVFSTERLLNRSFNDPDSKHESCIDFDGLRKTYELLNDPVNGLLSVLVKSTERLLAQLSRNMLKLYQAQDKDLRQLLILLENTMLSNHDDSSLLKQVSLIVGNLHGKSKQTLIRWISKYDEHGFTRLLRVFKFYVIQHFNHQNRTDESQLSSLHFLRLLFEANLVSKSTQVPTNAFYIESLSKIDFKSEYKLISNVHTRSKTIPLSNASQTDTSFSYFNFPFLFDPVAKTRIMHIDAIIQMSQKYEDAFVHQALVIHTQRFLDDSDCTSLIEKGLRSATNPFLVLEVNRLKLVEDVMNQLRIKQADLKKPLKVRFIDGGEEGQDQGGVQKEFFQVLVDELLDPLFGMFTYEEETRQSWINGNSLEDDIKFEYVGMIIALALYNGVILGVSFPKLIYKKILGERTNFEDFKDAFPSLGKGLEQLQDWSDGDVSDVFMRTFEISYSIYGNVVNYDIMPNGSEELVTNSNRSDYIKKYTHHMTHTFISKQFTAFNKGFHKVVGGQALHMCNAEELELLICGSQPTDFDFNDLERAALYDDGYSESHHVIEWFWSIVHAMTFEQKQMLLMFVTASDRIPLKGLGHLTFVVQRNGPDSNRLPTALTCFGRLLLPEYSDYPKLKDRLLTAIENGKGFGLV